MSTDSIAVAFGVTSVVLWVVLYVWMALALSALFRKAGEDAWKGWVPFVNLATVLKLGGFSPWLVLLTLVPPLGLAVYVLIVIAAHRINLAFGYRGGMTVLAALLFVVWASVLGFGSARWIAASAPSERAEPMAAGGWVPTPSPGPAAARSSWTDELVPPRPPAPVWETAADTSERASAEPAVATSAPTASAPPIAPITSVPGVRPVAAAAREHELEPEPLAVPVAEVPPAPPAPPQAEPWAPVHRPAAEDAFLEPSEAVSAVVGAPDAGAPRSARASVSAMYTDPEIVVDEPEATMDDDAEDPFERTMIARRRRTPWTLVTPDGTPIDIGSDVVILGRRPAPDPAYPDAQLIAIPDETRTVSKTHARLELRGDTWYVTDLGSTNGVLFATFMGTEVEAQPGQELEAGERFFLGDAEVRLRRTDT